MPLWQVLAVAEELQVLPACWLRFNNQHEGHAGPEGWDSVLDAASWLPQHLPAVSFDDRTRQVEGAGGAGLASPALHGRTAAATAPAAPQWGPPRQAAPAESVGFRSSIVDMGHTGRCSFSPWQRGAGAGGGNRAGG